MGNLWDYDGTVIKNQLDHTVVLIPYRADGQLAETNSKDIKPETYRLINNDHIGDNDYYIMCAFMAGAEIPPHIGITAGVEGRGGGGQLGISGGKGGFVVGFQYSETNTIGFSTSMAAAIVPLTKNSARNRYESNANYRVVEKPVKALVEQGRVIKVDGAEPQSVDTKVWVIEKVGERDRDAERRNNRASQGW